MIVEEKTEFSFQWEHLGDIENGRPNLGNKTSVAIYRLMQYTLRDIAAKHTDAETVRKIFFEAGHLSGKAIYENLIVKAEDFNDLIAKFQNILTALNIAILRMESADLEKMEFTMSIYEDLDCSGLPVADNAVCTYDEGLIAGVLEAYSGQKFNVVEIDCWCTGERTCRFLARCVK